MTSNLFMLKGCKLIYPSIYEPRRFADTVKYGVGFTTEDPATLDRLDEHGVRPKDGGGFNAQSTYRPLVTCGPSGYGELEQAFKIAELRNLSRDRLFKGAEVCLLAGVYHYEFKEYRKVGLSVSEVVVVNPESLRLAALNHTNISEGEADGQS